MVIHAINPAELDCAQSSLDRSARRFTSKQMGDACEMLVAAELIHGLSCSVEINRASVEGLVKIAGVRDGGGVSPPVREWNLM